MAEITAALVKELRERTFASCPNLTTVDVSAFW